MVKDHDRIDAKIESLVPSEPQEIVPHLEIFIVQFPGSFVSENKMSKSAIVCSLSRNRNLTQTALPTE